jgi:hypothetical protein
MKRGTPPTGVTVLGPAHRFAATPPAPVSVPGKCPARHPPSFPNRCYVSKMHKSTCGTGFWRSTADWGFARIIGSDSRLGALWPSCQDAELTRELPGPMGARSGGDGSPWQKSNFISADSHVGPTFQSVISRAPRHFDRLESWSRRYSPSVDWARLSALESSRAVFRAAGCLWARWCFSRSLTVAARFFPLPYSRGSVFSAPLRLRLCSSHLRPWHCLYFLPLPQGQGSLRPTLGCSRRMVSVFCCTPWARMAAC